MTYTHIRLDPGKVATITLARPERLNALSAAMIDEITAAVGEVTESDARALLITGEGRGFSSGADLAADAGSGLPEDVGASLEQHFNPMIEALFALPIPIVTAVNGPAAGAGCSLALAGDIIMAAESAYFLQAFVNVGLIPDAGANWLLPRLAGRARAMEMMMLGDRIPAATALDWGMINRVVADDALPGEARAMAERLANGPTVALGLIRRIAREAEHSSLSEILAAERAGQKTAGESGDFKRAVFAFLSKQPPVFEGR
ncbi:enoyl-CoA hydratase-related protein [Allosphingosinicella indica]|uniref:Enoyl-CoA hydratase n=1 Tax=Allosphingosinicella indica TaxID=941907 RepID=A0A1X7GAC6_9SPHN|nr:enoyl-CoA hydratase-related protein [Allosphingosinicella indica]SMF66246.1 Enoyl-CoA hydratase [Allosphingosinicella indica]